MIWFGISEVQPYALWVGSYETIGLAWKNQAPCTQRHSGRPHRLTRDPFIERKTEPGQLRASLIVIDYCDRNGPRARPPRCRDSTAVKDSANAKAPMISENDKAIHASYGLWRFRPDKS